MVFVQTWNILGPIVPEDNQNTITFEPPAGSGSQFVMFLSGTVWSNNPPGWVGVRVKLNGEYVMVPPPTMAAIDRNAPPTGEGTEPDPVPAQAAFFDDAEPGRHALVPLLCVIQPKVGEPNVLTLEPLDGTTSTNDKDWFSMMIMEVPPGTPPS